MCHGGNGKDREYNLAAASIDGPPWHSDQRAAVSWARHQPQNSSSEDHNEVRGS
jgi:hypothetical protein